MKIPPTAFRLFQKAAASCRREDLLPPGSLIVAGVSGGVDSMLLLAFLQHIQKTDSFDLAACHVNHRIRRQEADLDQALVEEYCQVQSIPLETVQVDVPGMAQDEGMGLEAAGRVARRRAFEDAAARRLNPKIHPAGFRIALAHHLDDRAESILLHMGRGTGLGGLVGIRHEDGPYVRPFLDIRRGEIEEAAASLDLPWREDASNRSEVFLRNRIRRRLLPLWEEILGYDPAPLLAGLGTLAGRDDAALEDQARFWLQSALLPDGSLAVPELAGLPSAVQARVLQKYLGGHIKGGREEMDQAHSLSRVHIEELMALLKEAVSQDKREAALSLPGGGRAEISMGRLRFAAGEKI